MRVTKGSTENDELSAPSSVQSMDSYGVFGNTYSDFSDFAETKEARRQRPNRGTPYYTPASSVGTSYWSAMERLESSPLLQRSTTPLPHKVLNSSDSLGPGELSSREILYTYQRQFVQSEKCEKKTNSSLVTIFSVWNAILGSSLLTMAWGVERAGLSVALILVAFMAALCLYTAYILLKVNNHHGSATCEVPALCKTLLGTWAERVAHLFSLTVLVGANIVYWILITNFLYFTVNYFIDLSASNNSTQYNSTLLCPKHGINSSLIIPTTADDTSYWGLHTTAPVFVAVIIFPLLSFKNVSFFTKFNSFGTLSVMYLLVFVIVKSATWGINVNSIPEPRLGMDAAVLSGMLALSFYIHNIIITIMNNNRTQEKNGRDLTIAFLLVAVTYILVGAVFYVCFPLAKSCIEDNILNNFEIHDVMTAVARMLLLFQVVTVYPLVAYMLRTETILLMPLPEHWKQRCSITFIVNVMIVLLCILMACFCPSIGTIIRYTGAVSGLVHVFTLPSLLHLRSLHLRGELTWWKGLFYLLVIVFGAVNLLMQFFITE